MPGLIIETPAARDPVSLAEAKLFLRVDDDLTADDVLITSLISASTKACEIFARRSFINKGFKQTLDSFPYYTDSAVSQMAFPPNYHSLPRYSTTLWNYSQMIKLFRPPLVSVDRITYMSADTRSYTDLIPSPDPWYPQTVYQVGARAADRNGNLQTLTSGSSPNPATSGVAAPTWSTTIGGLTVETTGAVWINGGAITGGEFGTFIVDTANEPGRVFPGGPGNSWPSVLPVPNAVHVHFTAGYGSTAASVPAHFRTAILLLVSDCCENRTPVSDDPETLPRHVRQLLWIDRVMDFAPTRG